MAMSPTQLSIRHLKENGYLVAVVEKWNPFVKIRQDLFGFIDVLAIKENETLAVQVTSAANMKARLRKIEDIETLPKVRDANWRIEIHGWKKEKNKWVLSMIDIS